MGENLSNCKRRRRFCSTGMPSRHVQEEERLHIHFEGFAHIITLTGLLNTFRASDVLMPSLRSWYVNRWAVC